MTPQNLASPDLLESRAVGRGRPLFFGFFLDRTARGTLGSSLGFDLEHGSLASLFTAFSVRSHGRFPPPLLFLKLFPPSRSPRALLLVEEVRPPAPSPHPRFFFTGVFDEMSLAVISGLCFAIRLTVRSSPTPGLFLARGLNVGATPIFFFAVIAFFPNKAPYGGRPFCFCKPSVLRKVPVSLSSVPRPARLTSASPSFFLSPFSQAEQSLPERFFRAVFKVLTTLPHHPDDPAGNPAFHLPPSRRSCVHRGSAFPPDWGCEDSAPWVFVSFHRSRQEVFFLF